MNGAGALPAWLLVAAGGVVRSLRPEPVQHLMESRGARPHTPHTYDAPGATLSGTAFLTETPLARGGLMRRVLALSVLLLCLPSLASALLIRVDFTVIGDAESRYYDPETGEIFYGDPHPIGPVSGFFTFDSALLAQANPPDLTFWEGLGATEVHFSWQGVDWTAQGDGEAGEDTADIWYLRTNDDGELTGWSIYGRFGPGLSPPIHDFEIRSDVSVDDHPFLYTNEEFVLNSSTLAWHGELVSWSYREITENVPLSLSVDVMFDVGSISDGAGGSIVTWRDNGRGTSNMRIYAQRVLEDGIVDPRWPTGGRILCAAPSIRYDPRVISDGAGGAIVAWSDYRSSNQGGQIYAQHVLEDGSVDPSWPADGLAVCPASNFQARPVLVSDDNGGAIIAWSDSRSTVTGADVYAQHVRANGTVDPAWPVDGTAICISPHNLSTISIVSEGTGGAIVCWIDFRSGHGDIYAQHVWGNGVVDLDWPINGRPLSITAANKSSLTAVSDGNGGAIATWSSGTGISPGDLHSQYVMIDGTLAAGWPVNGLTVCNAPGFQHEPTSVADGSGGAIVTWYDNRDGGDHDIYAQHVLGNGTLDPAWPAGGLAVCAVASDQRSPAITTDGDGGAIISWSDARVGPGDVGDIYAQRVLAGGTADPRWPVNGGAVCTATDVQEVPVLIPDGQHGAIVAWLDNRGGAGRRDVYAQRVNFFGTLTSVEEDAPLARNSFDLPRPNPFNPVTRIPYTMASPGRVRIQVFDITGRLVRTVEDSTRPAGQHTAEWDGRTNAGESAASGAYFGRITFPDGSHSERKLTILR